VNAPVDEALADPLERRVGSLVPDGTACEVEVLQQTYAGDAGIVVGVEVQLDARA
jgi:hypothetical protein